MSYYYRTVLYSVYCFHDFMILIFIYICVCMYIYIYMENIYAYMYVYVCVCVCVCVCVERERERECTHYVTKLCDLSKFLNVFRFQFSLASNNDNSI